MNYRCFVILNFLLLMDSSAMESSHQSVTGESMIAPVFTRVASNATYGCRRPHGYGFYDSQVDSTFVCWNGPGMTILGRSFDHESGVWSEDTVIKPLAFYGKWDYHNYPNMAAAPDGHILVAWADHCESLQVSRSEFPSDLSGDWTEMTVSTSRPAYPMLFSSGEKMYLFYSVDEERSWPYRSFGYVVSEDNGQTWSEHRRGIDTEKKDPDHIDEIYAYHFFVVDEPGEERVQFSWVMRGGPNGHNRGSRNGYFASFIPSTGTWQGADGIDLGEWIDFDEMLDHCLVADTGPILKGYGIDKIVSATLPDSSPIVVYNLGGSAHQAEWDGEAWQSSKISDLNAKSIRELSDGTLRLLVAPPSQPSIEVLERTPGGGHWTPVFSAPVPYDNGATSTWSMSFIENARLDLEILMSQIERGQEKVDYSGSWPVWAVGTEPQPVE
tara:strand:- start:2297 stop:3616 length:1320 start_codon:yes stop_codon:yes gene_type:complete